MDELQMNKITELAQKFAIKSLWTMWFDALSELTDLDIAILYTLYSNNPKNGTKEWIIKEIVEKMNKNFNGVYESVYGHLQPKGLIMVNKKKGSGNSSFVSLTTTGEKFVYEATTTSKNYLEQITKKMEKPINEKQKIKLL